MPTENCLRAWGRVMLATIWSQKSQNGPIGTGARPRSGKSYHPRLVRLTTKSVIFRPWRRQITFWSTSNQTMRRNGRHNANSSSFVLCTVVETSTPSPRTDNVRRNDHLFHPLGVIGQAPCRIRWDQWPGRLVSGRLMLNGAFCSQQTTSRLTRIGHRRHSRAGTASIFTAYDEPWTVTFAGI